MHAPPYAGPPRREAPLSVLSPHPRAVYFLPSFLSRRDAEPEPRPALGVRVELHGQHLCRERGLQGQLHQWWARFRAWALGFGTPLPPRPPHTHTHTCICGAAAASGSAASVSCGSASPTPTPGGGGNGCVPWPDVVRVQLAALALGAAPACPDLAGDCNCSWLPHLPLMQACALPPPPMQGVWWTPPALCMSGTPTS